MDDEFPVQDLRDGKMHQKLTEKLVGLGAKPKRRNADSIEDTLERYRQVPLHAVFLYTSEDPAVAAYLLNHWGAIDTLAGDVCDMLVITDQFSNESDAYDYIEKLHVVREAHFRAYSELPGLFFWDQTGDFAFISFGPNAGPSRIRRVLRIVFEELHRAPTLASVRQAGALLGQTGRPVARVETRAPEMVLQPQRFQALISFSPDGKHYLEELHSHLAYYVRTGAIDFWDEMQIPPGADLRTETAAALQRAKVAVVLVSADFLALDSIATHVLPVLLAAARERELTLFSVILSACAFSETALAHFPTINSPRTPVSNMSKGQRAALWKQVAELIKDSLQRQ